MCHQIATQWPVLAHEIAVEADVAKAIVKTGKDLREHTTRLARTTIHVDAEAANRSSSTSLEISKPQSAAQDAARQLPVDLTKKLWPSQVSTSCRPAPQQLESTAEPNPVPNPQLPIEPEIQLEPEPELNQEPELEIEIESQPTTQKTQQSEVEPEINPWLAMKRQREQRGKLPRDYRSQVARSARG